MLLLLPDHLRWPSICSPKFVEVCCEDIARVAFYTLSQPDMSQHVPTPVQTSMFALPLLVYGARLQVVCIMIFHFFHRIKLSIAPYTESNNWVALFVTKHAEF